MQLRSLPILIFVLALSSHTAGAALQVGDIVIPEFFAQGLLTVNRNTGVTAPLSPVDVDFNGLIKIDRQNQIVFLDQSEHLTRLNPATGIATPISPDTFTFANGLDFEANGNILISSDSGVFRVNPQTGVSTLFSQGTFFSPSSLAVTPTGEIYINEFFNRLQRIDSVTGAATPVVGTSLTIFDNGMISDRSGFLIALNNSNLLRINPNTGVQTTITPNIATFPRGLAIEPDGNILVATNEAVLRVNPTTGAFVTLSTGTFFSPEGIAVAVPEPSSLALLSLAAVGLIVAQRAARPRRGAMPG